MINAELLKDVCPSKARVGLRAPRLSFQAIKPSSVLYKAAKTRKTRKASNYLRLLFAASDVGVLQLGWYSLATLVGAQGLESSKISFNHFRTSRKCMKNYLDVIRHTDIGRASSPKNGA